MRGYASSYNIIPILTHRMNSDTHKRITALGLLVTIGIVFGDIGTSPLYVMRAVIGATPNFDADYIIGAVSCVIWTLTLQTTLKYVIIALRADNNGEGGILSLFALLRKMPRRWLYIVAAAGAAALIADGVITPAITVTSAIEGLNVVFGNNVPTLPIVLVIIALLFAAQQLGTGRIGRFFGPFMLAWFVMLAVLGICRLPMAWQILSAFNPYYAIHLLWTSPEWFVIVGAIFLCTTGAEALYSDLGHCGRRNITITWCFVKASLILNYMGQGAWLIAQSENGSVSVNPFYGIMPSWMVPLGIAMATGAAVIASQALISGAFTMFSEAVNLNFWPSLRIKYPGAAKGQPYIPMVNMALFIGCIMTLLVFRNSSAMEAAYGLAITITMLMTTALMTLYLRRHLPSWACISFAVFFGTIECLFLVGNLSKFEHGGWYTMLIACVIALIMAVWHASTRMRSRYIEYINTADKLPIINDIHQDNAIPMFASNVVYFSRSSDPGQLEDKLLYSIINRHPKRADHYWLIHIERCDTPHRLEYDITELIPGTMFFVKMYLGFHTNARINVYLRQIIEDMVAQNKISITSSYPSLNAHGIAGDFIFVELHRVFSTSSDCKPSDRRLMIWHERLRRLGVDDCTAMGLDTSSVVVETVPLIISSYKPRRITRIAHND